MKLFEPITIRNMVLKNRIMMSAMNMMFGLTNSRARAFYRERARGGVAAIILGGMGPEVFADDEAWGKPGAVNSFIERLQQLTSEVHEAGAKIGVELFSSNLYPSRLDMTGGEFVAPSARIEPDPSRHPLVNAGDSLREITVEEIEAIIATFARGAQGVKNAGFDFVELHYANGHLFSQFLSTAFNQRTDKYGGDLDGRMRFCKECAIAVRAAVGDDYPIFSRQGVFEHEGNGITLADGVQFSVEMEKVGIDVMDVTYGNPPISGGYVPSAEDPVGTYVHLAEAVKERVRVPVAAVGRITPEVAEAILSQGKADLVAIGRQLIVDPFWPEKVATGKIDDIVRCIDCHECIERCKHLKPMACTVNACAGKEEEYRISAAAKQKKVFVIGGGPAGMEAARVAAMRGHRVLLHEKAPILGGVLTLQAILPFKSQIELLAKYLAKEVKRHGVEVELGKETSSSVIDAIKPDAVIFAMGGIPVDPEIPGLAGQNVMSSKDIRDLLSGNVRPEKLTGWRRSLRIFLRVGSAVLNRSSNPLLRKWLMILGAPIVFGKRITVLGGKMATCQLADFLAERGKKVTIVASEEKLAYDMVSTLRLKLLNRLAARGVVMLTNVNVNEVTDRGVVITSHNGEKRTIEADTIIPIGTLRPSTEIVEALKDRIPEVYVIGDCAEPRKVLDAIADGARVGREV